MFGFQLEDCKNMFEPKVIIEFILSKHTFRPKHTFTSENQTRPKMFPFLFKYEIMKTKLVCRDGTRAIP